MPKKIVVLLTLFALLIGMLPAVAQGNSALANKDLVQNALTEFNSGNPEAFYNLFAEQYVMNQGGTTQEPMSRADVEGYAGALLAAMPDLQIEAAVLIGQGDQVAVELTFSGTFSQPFNFAPISSDPFPPTNQPVQWTEMDFLHFNDAGQVDEEWALGDPMVMFAQLGVVPAEDNPPDGTLQTEPAGYQALGADELAATFTSGMEDRNAASFSNQMAQGLIGFSQNLTDPVINWTIGQPYSVTTAQREENKPFFNMLEQAMPDVAVPLITVVAEGDWVAAVAEIQGTFTQDVDFFGTPLTHTDQPIAWLLGFVARYNADGQIVETWSEGDATPMLQGLGIIPAFGE